MKARRREESASEADVDAAWDPEETKGAAQTVVGGFDDQPIELGRVKCRFQLPQLRCTHEIHSLYRPSKTLEDTSIPTVVLIYNLTYFCNLSLKLRLTAG